MPLHWQRPAGFTDTILLFGVSDTAPTHQTFHHFNYRCHIFSETCTISLEYIWLHTARAEDTPPRVHDVRIGKRRITSTFNKVMKGSYVFQVGRQRAFLLTPKTLPNLSKRGRRLGLVKYGGLTT